MNMLSWMLYFAGVTQDVTGFFFTVGFIGAVAGVLTGVFSMLQAEADMGEHVVSRLRRVRTSAIFAAPMCLFIAAVLPDKDTIYLIAASEMGEEVIESETGGKVKRVIDKWLDEQLEEK